MGLGWDISYDGWVTYLGYTWLQSSESIGTGLLSGTSKGIEPLWLPDPGAGGDGPPSIKVTGFNSSCKMKYNIIDLDFFRPSYFSRHFILTPVFSFRGGWITQQVKIDYNVIYAAGNAGILGVRSYQRSALIGPKAGFKGNLLLGQGVRFDGKASIALLYEELTTKMIRQSYNTPGALSTNVKNKERFFSPYIDLSLGFGWGSFFHNKKWYLDTSLVYDIQYYWNENNMRHIKDDFDQRVYTTSEPLILHGITLTLRIDL